jgi:diacylglycerol kinase
MSKFSIKERIKSFKYAFEGIFTLLKSEHNAWIHLAATIVVVSAGFILEINRYEWMIIVACIASVFSLEAINTAIEGLADVVQPEKDDRIKQIKDLAAGAVLIAAIASIIIAGLIFIPKICCCGTSC